MIVIIGYNKIIAEGIADLLPEEHETQFIKFPPERAFSNKELQMLVKYCSLIVINLDSIYKSALEFIQSVKKLSKSPNILALDSYKSSSIAKHLIHQGVSAYLPITTNTEDLSKAIKACLEGKSYISV